MKSKPTARFVHYAVPKSKETLPQWLADGLVASANEAFTSGALSRGKSVDEIEDLSKSIVILDTVSGNVRVSVDGRQEWFRPSHPCPDCSGNLLLRKKFFRIGSPASPWKYLCENHEGGSCKSVFAANKGGELTSPPVNAATREARKTTTGMFERLWQEAPDIIEWAGDPSEMKGVINKAKARGYRYLASKMIEAGHTEKQISKMDIPTLRVAFKVCRDADIADVMKF